MSEEGYSIHTDVRFEPLELIDIAALGAENEPWFNQSLCRVNDCVVRIGVVEGDFHWHHHDEEDEFFYVVEGRWIIDRRSVRNLLCYGFNNRRVSESIKGNDKRIRAITAGNCTNRNWSAT